MPSALLPVTAVYAGLLTLWIIYLTVRVGQMRTRHKVSLGDGGERAVLHASRAHGNAVETIPLTLLLMALAESIGAPAIALHLLGLGLVAARVLHGMYFFGGARVLALRSVGMGLTALVQLVLALGLLAHGIGHLGGGATP
ncbi:MAG: MAPEG family protein [Pseudomonadota bacterium]